MSPWARPAEEALSSRGRGRPVSVSQLRLSPLQGSLTVSVSKVAVWQTWKRACAHRHGPLTKADRLWQLPEPLTAKTRAESVGTSRCLVAS